jgi:c-di-GMP-binding flagellar brake protein YcgR
MFKVQSQPLSVKNEPRILTKEEFRRVLLQTLESHGTGDITFLSGGRWYKSPVQFVSVTADVIHVKPITDKPDRPLPLQVNQPVGLSFQLEFHKYLFETEVVGFETSGGQIAIFDLPDKAEQMQRRAYARVPVPKNLAIKVLFWHRGYTDDSREVPIDRYWQGKLMDLSAGGAQISIELHQKPSFRIRQVVGMQFTPMYYQHPILVEAQIIHLDEAVDTGLLTLGMEFLGLETSAEGRTTLHRLKDIVEIYERENDRLANA